MLQADIVDIRFLAKSAVDPKYCLLFVDLFTSKIYVYPRKIRSVLARKMELFNVYKLTKNLIQKQKKKKLNKKFDVEMYQRNLCDGKAFAAEQKIREFKTILLRSKQIEKTRKKD